MLSQLFIVLGTLHYGCCGNWSVQYGAKLQEVPSRCTTIRCSYTYPLGHQVKAEIWTGSPRGLFEKKEVIAYHTIEDLVDPYFKGRTTFLRNKKGDCAIYFNDVTWEDSGEYRFKLETNLSVFSAEDKVSIYIDPRPYYRRNRYGSDTPKGIQTVLLSSFMDQSHGGDTTLLKCVVIASNPAVSNYSWYKDGSQIPNQSLQIISIENMKITELGRFSCVAHNEVGPSLPSPSKLVSFTEGVPRTSQTCSSFPSDLLIGISVAAVVAIIISVALSTWCYLKNKKKSNPAKVTELALKPSQHESGNLFYSNMENAYAALDKTQISSDYEEVRRQDRPT